MSNGRIFVQIGKIQKIFEHSGYYYKGDCDLIEHLISCNKAKLSEQGGNGRIRFIDKKGNLIVQLSIFEDSISMSDEEKAIISIRVSDGTVKSQAYYGVEAQLEFEPAGTEYSMSSVGDCLNSLKSFYKSWLIKKGEISSVVIIVDRKDLMDSIKKDSFFDNCYVLLAE